MKKKIKDLTEEERNFICNKYFDDCENCPYHLDLFGGCCTLKKYDYFLNGGEEEVEVDE